MADSKKDQNKADVKRGKTEYRRDNGRGKYVRPGKHQLRKNEVETFGAVEGGFFKQLKDGLAGIADEALEALKKLNTPKKS